MHNYDIKRERRELYAPGRNRFEIVDVPNMRFLMADGSGNPNTSAEYRAVVQALYATSYAVRALAMEELGRKHTVGPLEGLWWADDLRSFLSRDKDEWLWRMMIVQPDWIEPDLVAAAKKRAVQKADPSVVERLAFEGFTEGRCVQVLHIGPYDEEAPTIAKMHDDFVPGHGLRLRGRHHEIYLGDPRRAEPSRLRTILRQPVEPDDA